jgi:preprotein translocase subunit YajC
MFASPAFAQAAGAAPSAGGASSLLTLAVPWVLILGIFYLLLWRPQQRQQKAHRARIEAAKKGDTVVTAGGLIGKVTKVDGDEVELELGPNVRVRAVKATLSEVRVPGGTPAND